MIAAGASLSSRFMRERARRLAVKVEACSALSLTKSKDDVWKARALNMPVECISSLMVEFRAK